MRELGTREYAVAVGRDDAVGTARQAACGSVAVADAKPLVVVARSCVPARVLQRRIAYGLAGPAHARDDGRPRSVASHGYEHRYELVGAADVEFRDSVHVVYRVGARDDKRGLLAAGGGDVPAVEAETLAALLVAVVPKPLPPRFVASLVRQVVRGKRKRRIALEALVVLEVERRSRHERVVLEVENVFGVVVGEVVECHELAEAGVERNRLEAARRV